MQAVIQKDIDGTDMVPCKLYIVADPQKRTGPEGFVVITQGDGSLAIDTIQHGIFWHRPKAQVFLDAYRLDLLVDRF